MNKKHLDSSALLNFYLEDAYDYRININRVFSIYKNNSVE